MIVKLHNHVFVQWLAKRDVDSIDNYAGYQRKY